MVPTQMRLQLKQRLQPSKQPLLQPGKQQPLLRGKQLPGSSWSS
jgi:hypothetical protein